MRYRLRTLLIVLAVGPVVLAGAWFAWKSIPTEEQLKWAREVDRESLLSVKDKLEVRHAGSTLPVTHSRIEEPVADLNLPFDANATPGFAPQ